MFLQRCRDDMANVWCLFEYVAYAFDTEKMPSATIESHLSAIKYFHRISRGFELDTTHRVIASALKGAVRSHADVGNQATVRRLISWGMLLAGEAWFPRGALGVGFCGLLCVLRFVS